MGENEFSCAADERVLFDHQIIDPRSLLAPGDDFLQGYVLFQHVGLLEAGVNKQMTKTAPLGAVFAYFLSKSVGMRSLYMSILTLMNSNRVPKSCTHSRPAHSIPPPLTGERARHAGR